jgi:hypothetical protein
MFLLPPGLTDRKGTAETKATANAMARAKTRAKVVLDGGLAFPR